MALSRRVVLGLGVLALGLGVGAVAFWPKGQAGYSVAALSVVQMKADNGLIVDVRSPDEWQQTGVIDGARLVPFTDAASFLAALGGDLTPDRELILICHSGGRSAAAAAALAGKIPNKIISVEGGMSRIIREGYQTVAPKMQ